MAKETLAEWIKDVMTDEVIIDQWGKLKALSLLHMVGNSPKEIDSVILGGDKQWLPDDLGKRFLGKATSYTQDTAGKHNFLLEALYEKDSEPKARKPFVVVIDNDLNNYGLATEPPTKEGLAQQAMRHLERMYELSIQDRDITARVQAGLITTLSDELKEVRKENREAWEIVQQAGQSVLKAQYDGKMDALQFERSSKERELWLSFAPALLNQIIGRDVFPQGTADTALVETIARSLPETTLRKLANEVDPKLWGVLASRFSQVLEKDNELKAKQEKLLTKGNPEDNAAGETSEPTKEVEAEMEGMP